MNSRQKIIDGAIAVLNEDFSATMDKIAERVGLSRRTLHRYFKDRPSLLAACWGDMMEAWQNAMIAAYDSSGDPIVQMERMLYAGIDCGVKYSFLNKLEMHGEEAFETDSALQEKYVSVRDRWLGIIPRLQQQQIISSELSSAWVRLLFANMITTTIQALQSGDIAQNDIKRIAWYSFRRSIGID